MRAVFAGDVAEVALDAFRVVDACHGFVVEVEVAPIRDARDAATYDVAHRSEAFFVEIVGEAVNHIFDDAITVVHDGGADLHGGRAEEKKLGGVAPCPDAADTANRHAHFRVARQFGNHVERDGFDGGAAVATVRGLSVDVRMGNHRVEVNADDGVDGVDE